METYSGLWINPFDIQLDQIRIVDIAHALALQCRYNGHCKRFYSIAQHSVNVARCYRDPILKKFSLLHDAAEAYLGDMISPLKHEIPKFEKIEWALLVKIYKKFCGRTPTTCEYANIKLVDETVLLTEANFLMRSKGKDWRPGRIPAPVALLDLDFWIPAEAETRFRHVYLDLFHKDE